MQVFQGLATMLETQVRLSSILCTISTSLGWRGRAGRSGATGTVEPLNEMIEYSRLWQSKNFLSLSVSLLCTYSKIVLPSFSAER